MKNHFFFFLPFFLAAIMIHPLLFFTKQRKHFAYLNISFYKIIFHSIVVKISRAKVYFFLVFYINKLSPKFIVDKIFFSNPSYSVQKISKSFKSLHLIGFYHHQINLMG